jgi:hypothetical protein
MPTGNGVGKNSASRKYKNYRMKLPKREYSQFPIIDDDPRIVSP